MNISYRRWFRLAPAHLVVGLLVVDGFLILSEWFDWFAFNRQSWTVLIPLAAVVLTAPAFLLWYATSLIFRWRFQYTVRSLLLFTVAVAIPCSWVAVEIRSERKQAAAARVLRNLGGDVESEQTWLGRLLRDDTLVVVTRVKLYGSLTTLTSDPVEAVFHAGVKQLEIFSLNNTEINDAELVHLESLSQLEEFSLHSGKVTDAGLLHLKGMKHLQILDLVNTQVTDAGLVHLEEMKQLMELYLHNTQVTDAGVKKLKQALPNCVIIY
jgi:hypothetical protein